MQKQYLHIIINFVTVLAVTLFFSCQSNNKNDVELATFEDAPIAEAFDVNMKYTSAGKLKAVLKTPKALDYTHKNFPYHEFPEGIILDVIDEEGNISVIKSDFAIWYEQTNLIDMRGNVDILTADSTHLIAQQLYWDQNISWVFTDFPYKSILSDGTVNEADGFDANQDFTILNSRTNEGIMIINE